MELYEILGVPPTATKEEIRSAFRKRAKELHPDLNPSTTDEAFKALLHAYKTLMDDEVNTILSAHLSKLLIKTKSEVLLTLDIIENIKICVLDDILSMQNKLADTITKQRVISTMSRNLIKHTGNNLLGSTFYEETTKLASTITELESKILINKKALDELNTYKYAPVRLKGE